MYEADSLELMRRWPDGSFDHCITDPPFGISSANGRRGKKGLGWAFSSHVTIQESWDDFTQDEFFRFNVAWLSEVCRLVKPNGNILVFGTYHNIFQLGFILQHVLRRRVNQSIVWFKPNAQPNITRRCLTESTEQIIWAVNETPERATNWTFNYWDAKELNGGKQLRNLWEIPYAPASERRHGKHPSQKPEALLRRLLLLMTKPEDFVLDCFGGTGTTAVEAERQGRRWVAIERDAEALAIARKRLDEVPGAGREKVRPS